jgi:hypothetical protein
MLGHHGLVGIGLVAELTTGVTTTLTADTGAFTLTGNAALFQVKLLSTVGSYTYAGNAALFRCNLLANTTAYTLTGNAANLQVRLTCNTGQYTWSGRAIDPNNIFFPSPGGGGPDIRIPHPVNQGPEHRAPGYAEEEERKAKRDRDAKAKKEAAERKAKREAAKRAAAARREEERNNFPIPVFKSPEISVDDLLSQLGMGRAIPALQPPIELPTPDYQPMLDQLFAEQAAAETASDEEDVMDALAAIDVDEDMLCALAALEAAETAQAYRYPG